MTSGRWPVGAGTRSVPGSISRIDSAVNATIESKQGSRGKDPRVIMRIRWFVETVALLLMLLAAGGARAGDRPEKPVGDRPGLQVIRAWDEPIGPSAAGRKRHIELVFDHREGAVRRRVRDESGRLTSDATVIGYPGPSPEEIEQAFDVVRNDRRLGRRAGPHGEHRYAGGKDGLLARVLPGGSGRALLPG